MGALDDHASKLKLTLEGQKVRWIVFPGLFAGGGMDVMTTALLEALPPPPARARVLDFCCGSGTIGAVLRLRTPDISLHLLDADAVALEAARRNVPEAKKFHLSDAWSSVPEDTTYDWIVSNPPVHVGLVPDFGVLMALLSKGPKRLRPGGAMYLVTQTYVPVGPLRRNAESIWSDGRFTVWKVGPKGADAGTG